MSRVSLYELTLSTQDLEMDTRELLVCNNIADLTQEPDCLDASAERRYDMILVKVHCTLSLERG
jgi:hypothetical protein